MKSSLLQGIFQGKKSWFWVGLPFFFAICITFLIRFAPMLDWPLHLSQGVLLSQQNNLSFFPKDVYCVHSFAPYQLFHYLVAGMEKMVPRFWLSQTVLTFLLLLFWISISSSLRVFQRSLLWSVFCLPLFFGYLFIMGFSANLLGFSLLFLGLAFVQRWKETQHLLDYAMAQLFLLGTFFSHPVSFFMMVLILGVYFLKDFYMQRRFDRFWIPLPSFVLSFWMLSFLRQVGLRQKEWFAQTLTLKTFSHSFGDSFQERLRFFPEFLIGNKGLGWDFLLFSLLFLGTGLFFFFLQKNKDRTLLFFTLVCLCFYFFLPNALMKGNNVYPRFAMLIFIFCLLQFPHLGSIKTRGLYIVSWMSILWFLNQIFLASLTWSTHYADLYRLAQKIPTQSRLLSLSLSYRNAGTWVQVFRGGEVRYSFSHHPHMPIQDCDPFRQKETYLLNNNPRSFRPSKHAQEIDYLLFFDRKTLGQYPYLVREKHSFRIWAEEGNWILLKKGNKL